MEGTPTPEARPCLALASILPPTHNLDERHNVQWNSNNTGDTRIKFLSIQE